MGGASQAPEERPSDGAMSALYDMSALVQALAVIRTVGRLDDDSDDDNEDSSDDDSDWNEDEDEDASEEGAVIARLTLSHLH